MFIGTQQAYYLVAVSILVLRYQPHQNTAKKEKTLQEEVEMNPVRPEEAAAWRAPEMQVPGSPS